MRPSSALRLLLRAELPVTGRLFMDKGFGSKKILPKEYF